jgi:hypothetical protein
MSTLYAVAERAADIIKAENYGGLFVQTGQEYVSRCGLTCALDM